MAAAEKTSLYSIIKRDIITAIQQNKLSRGDKLPTELELMQQYKVSRITVSKAMSELKEEGYITRFPSRGSFVSETLPEHLPEPEYRRPEHREDGLEQIAFVIPGVIGQFALNLISGIHRALPKEKYRLEICPSVDHTVEPYVLKRCLDSGVSGILLFPVDQEYYSEQVLKMKVDHYPFVLIDRVLPGIDTNYVVADNIAAGKMIGQHLKELGHQNIIIFTVTREATSTVRQRINGCRAAFCTQDHPNSHVYVEENLDINRSPAEFIPELRQMISQKKITAIVTIEEQTGEYLYSSLYQMGMQIPDDISLVCYDSPFVNLPDFDIFTHINQHEEQIGYEAGMILKSILEQNREDISRQVLTPQLIIKESTGPRPE